MIFCATDSAGSDLKKSIDSTIVSFVTTISLFFLIFKIAASLLNLNVSDLLKCNLFKYL